MNYPIFKNEDQLQAYCWQLAWNFFPQHRGKMWAVPNGGDRDIRVAKKLQATGVLPGVWDLHCYCNNRLTIIEMKAENGVLSEKQTKWGNLMIVEGAWSYVCYTVKQFKVAFWFATTGLHCEGDGWEEWEKYNG